MALDQLWTDHPLGVVLLLLAVVARVVVAVVMRWRGVDRYGRHAAAPGAPSFRSSVRSRVGPARGHAGWGGHHRGGSSGGDYY